MNDEKPPTDQFPMWLTAFQRAYDAPHEVAAIACPNCGARELELWFVLYGADERDGNVAFWCDRCLHGVALGPSRIPSSANRVKAEAAQIPPFCIVPPSEGEE